MLPRRALVTASLGAGLAGFAALAAAPATASPASAGSSSDSQDFPSSVVRDVEDIRRAVQQLAAHTASCQGFVCPAVEQIRQTQKQFFKANGKLPDFIDVGYDLFMGTYDWHIRTRQDPHLTRMADGRLTLRLFTTTLVLRADVGDTFLSVGYDQR
jgi:hypothetical protein